MFILKNNNLTIICNENRKLFALLFIGGVKEIKNHTSQQKLF